VVKLDAAVEEAGRLKSLGICVGRCIELVKSGDPLIVRVLGARVGLSARMASTVFVEVT
jgi:Fe2+ transport system protein FeoA